jgi:hypothetical protein
MAYQLHQRISAGGSGVALSAVGDENNHQLSAAAFICGGVSAGIGENNRQRK